MIRSSGSIRPAGLEHTRRPRFAVFACALVALVSLFATPTVRADLDSNMSKAIDRGIDWLLTAMKKDALVGDGRWQQGLQALETYALIVAGVDVKHPIIAKNLSKFSKNGFGLTYPTSCIVFALDAAINQIHGDLQFFRGRAIPDGPKIGGKHRRTLERAVQALIKLKHNDAGRWHYDHAKGGWDNSNVQFAVLGLGAGANRKADVSDEIWEEIALHFIETQQKKGPEVTERIELHPDGHDEELKLLDEDGEELTNQKKKKKKKKKDDSKSTTGVRDKKEKEKEKEVDAFGTKTGKVYARGWKYNAGDGHAYDLNMTNAGVSSLLLARENLLGKMDPEFEQKLNRSIRDGLGFLMANWSINPGTWEYYGLYSLEKTGDIGHIKKFGPHDWFNEVATKIVGEQARNGSWPAGGDGADAPELVRRRTAFALLILNRASSLLTARSRSERMVLTGPGAHTVDRGKRDNWVYLQHLDREIHIPSLFRTLRLRPSPKLIKLVNATVDDYPADQKGLLLPFLYKLRKKSKNENVQLFLLDNMAKITGVEYEKPSKYMVWFRRWQDVEKIGANPRKELKYLLKYYKNTKKSLVLRKRVIWALTHCRSREAAPLFLEDLGHDDADIRQMAYEALQFVRFKSSPPPFDSRAKKGARKNQVEAIRAWFEELTH